MQLPGTSLRIDISLVTLAYIAVFIGVFVMVTALTRWLFSRHKLPRAYIRTMAARLNIFGVVLLIFSTLPAKDVAIGGHPVVVTFLPVYLGLLPLLLAYEMDKYLLDQDEQLGERPARTHHRSVKK